MRDTKYPRFTKKHYELIAETIREAQIKATEEEKSGIKLITNKLVNMFNEDSEVFDYMKFYNACGV